MSYNVRYATAPDGADAWPNRKAMLIDLVRREAPDVIGVQEALYLQLGEIRAELPVYGGIGVGRDDGRLAGEFSAILYRRDRFDIGNSGTFWFSDTPEVPGSRSWGNTITRICSWALLREIATGRRFYIYNVHLDHQSQPSRERSVALLLERIAQREHPDLPVIVTGDFNAGEDNPAVTRMLTAFHDTYRVRHPGERVVGTFNGFRGDSTGPKIDYVWTDRFDTRGARILRDQLNGRYPSDHFPVTALLEFPAAMTQAPVAAGEMEGIVVTTARIERRLEDEPLRVGVVEEEEIAEKAAMTPGDIAMLLNETGGLRVQSTNSSLGRSSVRVQGMLGRYTQVLADGLPLYGEAGALDVMQIPPVDLGRVEVVKGTGSALYGGAALGGLVNLVSRRPDGTREVLLNATSRGGTDAVLWWSAERAWSLLASLHTQERRDVDDDGWSDMARYRRVTLRPRFHLGANTPHTVFATAGFMRETRSGGTMPGDTAPDGLPYPDELATTRADAAVSMSSLLSGGWRLGTRASFMYLARDRTLGARVEPEERQSGLAEATLSRGGDRLTWLGGVALNYDRLAADSAASFDYRFTVPAVFGQVEWSPGRRVTLAASARWDIHSHYGDFVSPRLSALLRAGGAWTVRASAGSGFFAPTPFIEEVDAVGLVPFVPFNVSAERGASASLDVTGALGLVELNATLFATRVTHQVYADLLNFPGPPIPPPAAPVHVNSPGPSRSSGLDLVARWRRGPVVVTGAYTLVNASREQVVDQRETVPLNPRHQGGLVAMFEGERTRLGWELYLVGTQALEDNPYRGESVGYLVTGLLVQHRVGRAQLFLNFENLTDTRMTRWQPLARPSYSARGGWTTAAWAPLEGRMVNGGVKLAF